VAGVVIAKCGGGLAGRMGTWISAAKATHVRFLFMTPAEDIEEAPAHLSPEAARAYVDARAQGLCHEGALEVALGVERTAAADAARLEAVEFKIAHLERAVQDLSDVLYRQQQQLDAALAMNQRLRLQLEEIESRTGDATAVEIPPHY
jgi:uncharacterized coiled-coil protein SlyX